MESSNLCSDCPQVGYPTDRTRCAECPRVLSLLGDSAKLSYKHAKAHPQANGDAWVLACQIDALVARPVHETTQGHEGCSECKAQWELWHDQCCSQNKGRPGESGGGLQQVFETPNLCPECGWEISRGSHAEDCSRRGKETDGAQS